MPKTDGRRFNRHEEDALIRRHSLLLSLVRSIATPACCLALVLLSSGCAEDIAAPGGLEEPFSMYGILNPRLETQTMLVSPIEALLQPLDSTIDAVVTSTDLKTGEMIAWTDSVVENETGQLDHVFQADFRPDFGSRHRIDVTRSDGAVSTVLARVPERVDVSTEDVGTGYVDVIVRGDDFHLLSANVIYAVRWGPGRVCETPKDSYEISHDEDLRATDDGYRFRVNLVIDHERVLARYQLHHGPLNWSPDVEGVAMMNMRVRLLVADPTWDPPGGVFDANVLVQPGIMSNVTNGYGFVGGGYNEIQSLFPSEEAVETTWFFDFMLRPPGNCFDYCNCR